MTNGEWLDYLAHNAPDELAAWFDAERTESPTSATMQQIRQVIEDTIKRGVYGDTESENEDSREQLEADAKRYIEHAADYAYEDTLWADETFTLYDAIIELLDRQAAITECEVRERIDKQTNDELPEGDALGWLRKWIAGHDPQLRGHGLAGLETIADVIERDYMWRNEHERIVQEMVDANTRQCERTNELTAERDEWKANCEDWKKHARAAENACYETMLEREDYRKKFGKCIDYADAIHALMDDEGMA